MHDVEDLMGCFMVGLGVHIVKSKRWMLREVSIG